MRVNILFGGPAGTGPNILTHLVAEALVKQGHYAFYSRDYQSLIRGGHNFNVLTFSDEPVYSNDNKIDVLVCLDEKTKEIHQGNLKEGGIILEGRKENMYYAGRIFKLLCLDFGLLESELKELEKRFEENLKEAKEGYDEEKKEICKINSKKSAGGLISGSVGIADGAVKSGLEIYYAYPMTPATPVLGELAQMSMENENLKVIELENEISVVNAGVGSCIVGAKAMVGTSGGGFDLMTEGLSLCGIAEIPLVFYLAQRPGPGTGVATYTGQGDLNIALKAGHGEFPRVVLAGGDPKECEELTSQAFYLSHKFKVPSIILSDKHLSESFYTSAEKGKITSSKSIMKLGRYNSYEVDPETGSATEDAETIRKNVEERNKKYFEIEKESEKFGRYKIFGKEKSKNVVVSYGSPKGAILDAINGLDVKFIQILYLDPFPLEIKSELEKAGKIILVENNATGQLANLIAEKTGIFIKDKILRYDGRPFLADELKLKIEEVLG